LQAPSFVFFVFYCEIWMCVIVIVVVWHCKVQYLVFLVVIYNRGFIFSWCLLLPPLLLINAYKFKFVFPPTTLYGWSFYKSYLWCSFFISWFYSIFSLFSISSYDPSSLNHTKVVVMSLSGSSHIFKEDLPIPSKVRLTK